MKKELMIASMVLLNPVSPLCVSPSQALAADPPSLVDEVNLLQKTFKSTRTSESYVYYKKGEEWVTEKQQVFWVIKVTPANEGDYVFYDKKFNVIPFEVEYEAKLYRVFEVDGKSYSTQDDNTYYINQYGRDIQVYDCDSTSSCVAGQFMPGHIQSVPGGMQIFLRDKDRNRRIKDNLTFVEAKVDF